MPEQRFDRAYYDRFYGDRETRVTSAEETARLARFVTSYLDYLGVAVETVLDVGCGVGLWRKPLKKAYPGATYTGLEFSEHIARKHGWVQGSIGTYRGAAADLVICQGVLQYVPDRQLPSAIANLARLSRQALYLEALTQNDWDERVDTALTDGAVHLRPASRYRRLLSGAGFRACGGGVYLGPKNGSVLFELEEGRDR